MALEFWNIKTPASVRKYKDAIIKKKEYDTYICKRNQLVKEENLTCDVLQASLTDGGINILLQLPDGKTVVTKYLCSNPSDKLTILDESTEKSYAEIALQLYYSEEKSTNLNTQYYDEDLKVFWYPIEINKKYEGNVTVKKLYIKKSDLQ